MLISGLCVCVCVCVCVENQFHCRSSPSVSIDTPYKHTRVHTHTHPWGRLHNGKASVDLRQGYAAEGPSSQELNTRLRLCRNPGQSRPGRKSISSRRACDARRDRRQAGRPHPGRHRARPGRWRGRSSGSLGQPLANLSGSHPSPSPVGSVWLAGLSCTHKTHDCFAQR